MKAIEKVRKIKNNLRANAIHGVFKSVPIKMKIKIKKKLVGDISNVVQLQLDQIGSSKGSSIRRALYKQ